MPKFLNPSTFKCDRYCGECCKKTLVPLRKEDIKEIKQLGYEESDFLMQDPFIKQRKLLKKTEKGWCIFLKKSKEGKYSCSIHKNRPLTCQIYPFFSDVPIETCLPEKLYPNVFFSLKNQQK